jgi:hypothetical protein
LYDRAAGTYEITGHSGIADRSLSGDGRYLGYVNQEAPGSVTSA